jgi:hypothetical protein
VANTTWNPADKSAGITLTGGNLIATGGLSTGVRGVDRQTAGKFYFEYTMTTWAGATCCGVATLAAGFSTASSLGVASVNAAGQVVCHGVSSGVSLGTRANGNIIGVAVDFTAKLIWFRVAPAGNWNNNATYSPATGVGGVNISAIGGAGTSVYPYFASVTTANSVTANFGDSAFSGVVPAGYTSGFPPLVVVAVGTDNVRVMVIA